MSLRGPRRTEERTKRREQTHSPTRRRPPHSVPRFICIGVRAAHLTRACSIGVVIIYVQNLNYGPHTAEFRACSMRINSEWVLQLMNIILCNYSINIDNRFPSFVVRPALFFPSYTGWKHTIGLRYTGNLYLARDYGIRECFVFALRFLCGCYVISIKKNLAYFKR